jgi:putative inorganic carbon (HCO3(-)) transporter
MRDIVLTITFIGLIPFVIMRPWIGVLVWSWIGYMNPHKLGWGFTTSLPVAMMFGGLTLATMFFSKDWKGVPLTWETVILFLLGVLFTVTTYFAWMPEYAWEEWDKVMKILLFTFVTMMLIHGRQRIYALLVVIAVSIGFFGVKGGIFAITTGGENRVLGPPGSFIEGNTSLGLALIMVLPLIMMLARHASNKWLRRGGYLSALLTIVATIFTYSRGAFIGLAAILPFIFLKSNKKILVLLLIIPLAWVGPDLLPDKLIHRAGTIQSYEEDNSSMQRIQAWGVAWNVALSRPLIGAGFRLEDAPDSQWLRYAMFLGDWKNRARAAHSIFFQMLGEHGFTGLILFVLLLVFTFYTLARVKRASRKLEGSEWIGEFATALQIGLIGYLVAGAFLSLAYYDLFYAYVALAVIMQREVSMRTEKTMVHRAGTVQARPDPPMPRKERSWVSARRS